MNSIIMTFVDTSIRPLHIFLALTVCLSGCAISTEVDSVYFEGVSLRQDEWQLLFSQMHYRRTMGIAQHHPDIKYEYGVIHGISISREQMKNKNTKLRFRPIIKAPFDNTKSLNRYPGKTPFFTDSISDQFLSCLMAVPYCHEHSLGIYEPKNIPVNVTPNTSFKFMTFATNDLLYDEINKSPLLDFSKPGYQSIPLTKDDFRRDIFIEGMSRNRRYILYVKKSYHEDNEPVLIYLYDILNDRYQIVNIDLPLSVRKKHFFINNVVMKDTRILLGLTVVIRANNEHIYDPFLIDYEMNTKKTIFWPIPKEMERFVNKRYDRNLISDIEIDFLTNTLYIFNYSNANGLQVKYYDLDDKIYKNYYLPVDFDFK